jgi:hypothetical protein
MAVGKRKHRRRQTAMWMTTTDLPTMAAHPFYARLNKTLDDAEFDAYVEELAGQFYAPTMGRPGLVPGVYFRLLLIGYFEGLDSGKTIGIDATTLEANAALRSNVRRDTGGTYQAFLTQLAQASGIEIPTREDLARIDRKRKNKGSNDDWTHPHDPDAKITKMKDGRTHLAHKAEHAVDLETGAVVAVTIQDADEGRARDEH